MTDKSAAAIREFAETIYHTMNPVLMGDKKMEVDYIISDLTALISEHCVERELYEAEKELNTLLHEAMITAEKRGHDKAMEAISEHYYPKEKYDELLQQRDELKEALTELSGLFEYLHGGAIVGKSIRQRAIAAIKNTER